MNPDRENNHLPLRAGAMLLLAVAVVALLLGIKSCSDSGKETAHDKLAGQNVPTETAATSAAATSSAAGSSTAQASSITLCVINAGTAKGLAAEVSGELKSAGFTIGTEPGNLSTATITENTVFYPAGQEDQAKQVAAAVPGGATTDERPSAFAPCAGEIAVIVVNK
ncbi:MAG: LytR C-terminal domain-containing protein [Gordonia sp. (in: high G+C Gram-positive bacteria)]|uniref:LytR C-terminal domain-containing protein n=1 Tax=Gordonia sp. (in: high G+C Gram-positive bacteria) TaxID=84139 RepID=UPI003BB55A54